MYIYKIIIIMIMIKAKLKFNRNTNNLSSVKILHFSFLKIFNN